MKVVRNLRSAGFSSVIYLDDILCIEDSLERCTVNVNATIQLLNYLGFIINYTKSDLTPSHECKFLGVIVDTHTYAFRLSQEKRKNILTVVENFLNQNSITIKAFGHLIGKLISCCVAVEYGWLYTKILEKEKIFHLIVNDYNYNKVMTISEKVKLELCWWKNNINEIFDI